MCMQMIAGMKIKKLWKHRLRCLQQQRLHGATFESAFCDAHVLWSLKIQKGHRGQYVSMELENTINDLQI